MSKSIKRLALNLIEVQKIIIINFNTKKIVILAHKCLNIEEKNNIKRSILQKQFENAHS